MPEWITSAALIAWAASTIILTIQALHYRRMVNIAERAMKLHCLLHEAENEHKAFRMRTVAREEEV